MPQITLRLQQAIVLLLLFVLTGVAPVHAGTKTYTWDAPRMDDGTLIPAAANIQYKLYYGPTSRGTAQRETFTYPQTTPPTAATSLTLTLAGGQRVCASVTAVAPALYTWTVGEKTYVIMAAESDYSNEVCTVVPPDPVKVPPPGNFRVAP